MDAAAMAITSLSATTERQSAYEFPVCPVSWHHLASLRELERGPVQVNLCHSGSFVGYRAASGKLAVLSARCSHVGSNLAKGAVIGENLQCPLHGWQFSPTGDCVKIPAGDPIPNWARQCTYPVQEMGGHVFFFNQPSPRFPLPFFDGVSPGELVAARSFDLLVDTPWYVASSNGFDLQHFRCAHDRVLASEPMVDSPHPFARRISARFKVAGSSWRDALTRRFSGSEVTMTVTDWCGNLIFTTAKFARTTTYGLLAAHPLDEQRTRARVIVFVRRSESRIGRWLVDPIDAFIRRNFIRAFLQPDVERTAGLHYHPRRLIESDRTLREYLEWLEGIHH
jgi:phenylpropionate dioxygenase-like ring-hydroxylating dioxygenase large terminal subunit